MPQKKKIPITEMFLTMQGEGALTGQISYFIRSAMCGYRCSWCDSLHSVLPREIKKHATYMEVDEIVDRLRSLGPAPRQTWVTLTGGDPCVWDMTDLVTALWAAGYRVAVETQGALWKDWLEQCNLVTCSPKPPSSGMDKKFKSELLQKYAARLQDRLVLKIVVFTEEDLAFAEKIHRWMPRVKFFLTSGTPMEDTPVEADLRLRILEAYRQLVERVIDRPSLHDVTVLPQTHALLWQRELGR